LDVHGEKLREMCGATVGCTGRVAERDLCSDSWMYTASGVEGCVERHLDVQEWWLRGMCAATFGFAFRLADR